MNRSSRKAGTDLWRQKDDVIPQQLVDENNLAKFGPGGYRRDDGKWIKPPGHKPPAIAKALRWQQEAR